MYLWCGNLLYSFPKGILDDGVNFMGWVAGYYWILREGDRSDNGVLPYMVSCMKGRGVENALLRRG